MQVNPYLFFDGNCEEALKYYQKALGAQIEAMMPYGDGPAEMPIPADWKTKIMHSRNTIDGEVLMLSLINITDPTRHAQISNAVFC
jgi:PhnB protein